MRLFLEPLAKADIRAAFEFYEQRRDGLGRQFKARLRTAFALIRNNPRAFPEIEPGVRWAMTDQFPFKVYFMANGETLHVVAVLHAAMHPDTWRSRQGG